MKCSNYKLASKKEAQYRGWCKFCSKKCKEKNNLEKSENNPLHIK